MSLPATVFSHMVWSWKHLSALWPGILGPNCVKDNKHFTQHLPVFTGSMLTNVSWNLRTSLFICTSRIYVRGSTEIFSLVSQFLPTFQQRVLARRSLRSHSQSLTSLKLYTTAWRCKSQFFRSLLLTAVNCNPVFMSCVWFLLSHEATMLL